MSQFNIILFSLLVVFSTLLSARAYSNKMSLKVGIAKTDITPTENLHMGGYDETCRSGPSEGSYGKIFTRALVFDDNVKKVAFIECDVVIITMKDSDAIRKLISEETNIPFENIMLGYTHNHATPHFGSINKNSRWYKEFKNKIVTTVKKAITNLEPVKIGGGVGSSNIAMNRRKKMEDTLSYLTFDENNSSQSYGKYKTDNPIKIREIAGVLRLGANPDGPIDDEVGILRIDKLTGEPKAIFINYACHGTSLGARNNKISPEWNGHMLEYVEENIPGVTGIFANGAAGDINPRFVGGLDGFKDNPEKTAELGYEIGREVVRVFNTITTAKPINSKIRLVHKDFICPRRYQEVMKDFRNTTITVPTTAVKIDDFTWVAFPLEIYHEIGKTIKASTHAKYPFIVGYCNGYLGYLPTQKAFSEGGYEPAVSHFAPVAEKIFIKEVKKMLIELF